MYKGRKYSLNFITSPSNSSLSDLITNSNNESTNVRRATSAVLCSSCRKLDTLGMRDDCDELDASQQVISLLQRQLEQTRLEKNSLEQLVIDKIFSYSHDPNNQPTTDSSVEMNVNDIQANMHQGQTSSDQCPNIRIQNEDADICGCRRKFLDTIRTQVYAKDEEILKLKTLIRDGDSEREEFVAKIKDLESKNEKLKKQNDVLAEMLELRDKTVVNLTNELFESEASSLNKRRQSSAEVMTSSVSRLKSQFKINHDQNDNTKRSEIDILKDNVRQLTENCKQTEKRELDLRSQNQELEAKCCQIQSKLLSLLKEIEQSCKSNQTEETDQKPDAPPDVTSNESVKILIKRLLEDKSLDIPLSWKEGNRDRRRSPAHSTNSDRSSKYACDDLGFYINNPTSPSRNGLATPSDEASILETISESATEDSGEYNVDRYSLARSDLSSNFVIIDAPRRSRRASDSSKTKLRWDTFVKNFDKIELSKSKEFKSLLRLGVPQEYRCKVWRALVNLRIGQMRESEYGPDYYQHLLNKSSAHPGGTKNTLDPTDKQIELDLLRTLPNNRHFESLDSSGTVRLKRVLTAFSRHNPAVNYCQGMNRIAAVALLALPEEDAFWCLVAIIENIMPKGYYCDLWLAQIDSLVVSEYISIKMPNLYQHLEEHGIELSLFAWFLTIFVDGMPPEISLRCWDSFLHEGDKVLFRVALGLIKLHEGRILKMTNSATVNSFLRSLIELNMDVDYLFEIAFNWTNPLSTKSLRQKREAHFSSVKAELDVMERHRVNRVTDDRPKQMQQSSHQQDNSKSPYGNLIDI